MGITSKVRTPHAAAIIWNYKERLGNYGATDVHAIEEIIVSTKTLVGITTSKRKSSPAGQFEMRLAPNINWVSKITPGSWCVLLMSQDTKINISSNSSGLGTANPKTLKMLGRIDSVRVAVDVDQTTGARKTEYVVTGTDWGSVFDTKVYIDPINTNNVLDNTSTIGHAALLTADSLITDWKNKGLPSSTETINAILKIWGTPLGGAIGSIEAAINGSVDKSQTGPQFAIQLTSDSQFLVPTQVAQYMGFVNSVTQMTQKNIHEILDVKAGVLTGPNEYEDTRESYGFLDPHSLYRINTLWQLLTDNCNSTLNELVTDLGFNGLGQCKLQLFKRIKPFANRLIFPGWYYPQVAQNTSSFSNIRTEHIPLTDVLNINAGTNWRDRVNFIEIRPQQQLLPENSEVAIKFEAQVIYKEAYEREGFRPLIESTKYMPFDIFGKTPSPLEATRWKYLLAEWYFNTDIMLNGSVTILGQDQYIAVGDNIKIDSTVLGTGSFSNPQSTSKSAGSSTYLVAHVESVSHTFSVDQTTGARTFLTTINFVRGIIADQSGVIVSPIQLASALDKSAGVQPINNNNVIVSGSPAKTFDNIDNKK